MKLINAAIGFCALMVLLNLGCIVVGLASGKGVLWLNVASGVFCSLMTWSTWNSRKSIKRSRESIARSKASIAAMRKDGWSR